MGDARVATAIFYIWFLVLLFYTLVQVKCRDDFPMLVLIIIAKNVVTCSVLILSFCKLTIKVGTL